MQMFKGTTRIRQAKAIWSVIGMVYLCIWSLPFWNRYSGVGSGTVEAAALLRDPGQFKWYIIPFGMLVVYLIFNELENGNIKAVLAAAAFFLADLFNEIWNGLYYTATGFASVWQVASPTAFQVLRGWNVEIMLMFFLCGLASTKLLPEDKEEVYFGWLNNRHFYAAIFSTLSVLLEIIFHKMGVIHWNYRWWQPEFPWVLFIIGYMPFYEVLYLVYDLPSVRKQVRVVTAMAALLVPGFALLVYTGMI